MPSVESKVPHETSATFEINGVKIVELFSGDQKSIFVRENEVDAYLQRGYFRDAVDIRATMTELVAALKDAPGPIEAWVEGVMEDSEINTSDQAAAATAERVLGNITDLYEKLYRTINQFYPVAQPVIPEGVHAPTGE